MVIYTIMKNLLAAILLATTALAANAEIKERKLQIMCGSFEDVRLTMEKYGEKLVLASIAPDKRTVNLLFANFETQSTSWFIQDLENNEYCMAGIGDSLMIPKESPLNLGIGGGTKVIHK